MSRLVGFPIFRVLAAEPAKLLYLKQTKGYAGAQSPNQFDAPDISY